MQSVDVSKAPVDRREGAYLNYSVAKSLFTIQIAQATSPAPAPATAAPPVLSAATAPATPLPAPTTWTISGTLTSSTPGASAASSSSSAPSSTDSSQCAVWTAEYTAAQTIVAGEISSYKTLTLRLSQMADSKPAQGDTPAKLAADLTTYANAVGDGSYRVLVSENGGTSVGSAPGIYDDLIKQCPPKVTVSVHVQRIRA